MIKKTILFLTSMMLIAVAVQAQKRVNEKDLKRVASMMEGRFSSEAQSLTDPEILHISLRMVKIWSERTDGIWLYVEQALASAEDKPYRQRIYHVYLQDEYTIVSKVYELSNPQQFAGAWRNTSKINDLDISSLIDRQGCSIYLRKERRNKFSGSTPGKECLSVLRGASYATSEVVITPRRLISWDRGWNDRDEQVWGSVGSGYIFDKKR